jgi:hypothetical protein
MKYAKIAALALAAALFGCNNDNPASPSDSGNNNGNDVYQSTVDGTISGSITGTIKSGEIWLVEGVNTGGIGGALMIIAGLSSSSSDNQITISSPGGITDLTFVSSLGFSQTPASGSYTQSSTSTCGGIAISGSSSSTIYSFVTNSENDCDGKTNSPSEGSYTLKLTSVKLVTTASNGVNSVKYYKVQGTLDATLPGSAISQTTGATTDDSVTVHLTF